MVEEELLDGVVHLRSSPLGSHVSSSANSDEGQTFVEGLEASNLAVILPGSLVQQALKNGKFLLF